MGDLEQNWLFDKFLDIHGDYWVDITKGLRQIDGLLLAVVSAWDGNPIVVEDNIGHSYFPYVRCYVSPLYKYNPFKRHITSAIIKNCFSTDTKVDIFYKNPLLQDKETENGRSDNQ